MSRLRTDQAEEIAHALAGTLESYLEDEYGGARVTNPKALILSFRRALQDNVAGVETKTITSDMISAWSRRYSARGRR